MKINLNTVMIAVLLCLVIWTPLLSAQDIEQFNGRWALFMDNGNSSWLEISFEKDYKGNDYPVASLLWRWGSVIQRTEKPEFMDGKLIVWRSEWVNRQKDQDKVTLGQQIMNRLEITMVNDNEIKGIEIEPNPNGPGFTTMGFTGKRIPDLGPAPDLAKVKFDKPVKLFNGKDLTGWKLTDEIQTNGWQVENGTLVNNPVQKEGGPHINYGNLMTEAKFEDFNLKLEVNVPAHSNSGIYLRGIYEIQVMDSYGHDLDSHNMGALYSRITPSVAAEKPAGEWQTFDITLCDRHLTVILNGTTIIDNQPVYGCTGGALTPDEFIPGPIYLQGDHGKVSYRNIVLTPIVN